jgi:aminopeptidase N
LSKLVKKFKWVNGQYKSFWKILKKIYQFDTISGKKKN